jgi:hypothetical protein
MRHPVELKGISKRACLLLTAIAALLALAAYLVLIRLPHQFPDSPTTPLVACQPIPPSLSEGQRHLYSQICSTDLKERKQGLLQLHYLPPSEKDVFLPLLAEVMTTDDYVINERARPDYMAVLAVNEIAFIAGTNAVPLLIKALQSGRLVEIHAGISGLYYLLNSLGWATKGTAQTNELRAVTISLLPYIHVIATSNVPKPYDRKASFCFEGNHAKSLEADLQRFLPPASSKD